MISKTNLANWHVLRGKSFEAVRPILGMFFNVYDLHGVLDASWYWMPHLWWRVCKSFWPDCHRTCKWPMAGPSMESS